VFETEVGEVLSESDVVMLARNELVNPLVDIVTVCVKRLVDNVTELVGVGSDNEREVLNETDLVILEDDEPVNEHVTVVLLLIVCVVAV